ncbi:MAG TPA: hypothetical protein VFO38_05915 [Candidatus Saccharimonadales bacterium]|nr:hypothetical protein [Candidatus Saccharimonadales bacterium]
MDVFRLHEGELQTAVLELEHPELRRVKLVAVCDIGRPDYFRVIKHHAGQQTSDVWLGFEALREVEVSAELSHGLSKRVETMRNHLIGRNKLANAVGLMTLRQRLLDLDGVNLGLPLNVFVQHMTKQHYSGVKRFTTIAKLVVKATDSQRARKAEKARATCRKLIRKSLSGQLRNVNDPRKLARMNQEDARQNDVTFSLAYNQLNQGKRVHLVLPSAHAHDIATRLIGDGYQLANQQWVDCLNLDHLG